VQSGPEDVGDVAFVHERSHLRLAHRELAAVLNLHIAHGVAIGENAVFRFIPLDNADELFGKKIDKSHGNHLKVTLARAC